MIPYNRPFIEGSEWQSMNQVMTNGLFSGRHAFAERCQEFFEKSLGGIALATSSCSQAFDLIAALIDYDERPEVLIPSFTYPTVASAFLRAGAQVRFLDSQELRPHLSVEDLEAKLSDRVGVVVLNHYAGQACDMDRIMALKKKHGFILVEDCAHAVGAASDGQLLGSFGEFSAFSFHETKNVQCGEGGMMVIKSALHAEAAKNGWCEGTNRLDFEQGKVKHYEWVSLGSSYQPAELNMAFLYAQLSSLRSVNERRVDLWNRYASGLEELRSEGLIYFPNSNMGHNAHIFYFRCAIEGDAPRLLAFLNEQGFNAVSHYQPLHSSSYWRKHHSYNPLPAAEAWSKDIIRLPIYYTLKKEEIDALLVQLFRFFKG